MKKVYPVTIQSGMSQTGSYVLMLHEPEEGRQIPIVIGQSEAQSILLAQNPKESEKIKRPTTHKLMVEVMNTYGLTLKKVTIDRVVEGVFYATLHISDGFNERMLDSRTSDAVTLALLTGAPVYADEQVIEDCGVRSQKRTTDESPESELRRLEEELHRCEAEENYERAAEIQARIDRLQKNNL